MNSRRITFAVLIIMLLLSACAPAASTPRAEAPQRVQATPRPTTIPAAVFEGASGGPDDNGSSSNISEPPTPTPVISPRLAEALAKVLKEAKQAPVAKSSVQPLLGAPPVLTREEAYIKFVADNVNAVWKKIYPAQYANPTLKYVGQAGDIYTGACIDDPSRTEGGPFYCPANETVYMVSSKLWDYQLAQGVDSIGDFALALLVAHEYGHHVQMRLGITEYVYENGAAFGTENEQSVKMELQADCLAGVWAYSVWEQGLLQAGDIEESIRMASLIGDDVLDHGPLTEAEFTHGYAEHRKGWFMHGYNNGKANLCDPFVKGIVPPGQPTPVAQGNAITNFFVEASKQNCAVVDDGFADTVQTIRCQYTGYSADFDLWQSEQAIADYVTEVRGNNTLWLDDSWSAPASGESGITIALGKDDGSVVFVWTVWGKPLTGTIVRTDGNLNAVHKWFLETGSVHKYTP